MSLCPSHYSNIFFSETACPIKARVYVDDPWIGGTKVYLRHLGHMTKMAAMPIHCKNPSKIFSRTGGPISTKLSQFLHWVPRFFYQAALKSDCIFVLKVRCRFCWSGKTVNVVFQIFIHFYEVVLRFTKNVLCI